MELLDCRRLTGPNLLWDRPSVVADFACGADQTHALKTAWKQAVRQLHQELGWTEPSFRAKAGIGGLSIAFDGPIDRLYAGIALAEVAWARCNGSPPAADDHCSIAERAAEEAADAVENEEDD